VDSFFQQRQETDKGECGGCIDRFIWRLLVGFNKWCFRAVKYRDVSSSRFGDDVFDQTIQELGAVLDGELRIRTELFEDEHE